MKITLINPSSEETKYIQPPLGLLYLAGAIRGWTDWRVQVLDGNFLNTSQLSSRAKDSDVVGVGAMTPNILSAIEVLKPFKELGMTTVLGGSHVSVAPAETLKRFPEVNVGVVGEGEVTLTALLKQLERGEAPRVDGIVCRRGGTICIEPPRQPMENLDNLPLPAYDLIKENISKYSPYPPHRSNLPFMPVLSARGCPMNCVFCTHSVWGRQYHAFSARYVFEHLKYLKDKYGMKSIQFYDDSFTLDKPRILSLCNLIREEGLDLPWSCETRVDMVGRELLVTMRRAGCRIISFGLESGCQRVLDELNKRITLAQSRQAVKWASEAGLSIVGYMMLGSQTETKDEIKQSIEFTKSLPLDFVQWSITTPYLGTPLYEKLRSEGKLGDVSWDGVGYIGLHSGVKTVIASENLSVEQLLKLSKQAYREFYLRYSYIFRRALKSATSLRELRTTWQGVKLFLEATGENTDAP